MHTRRSLKASLLSSLVIVALVSMPTTPLRAATSSSSGANNPALQAFMLTATYGVIAGSLTGLASLAFYKEAGAHTRNIAMGASLGLYVGLLLGAYVVYVPTLKSSSPSRDNDAPSLDQDPINLNSEHGGPSQPTPWVNWDPKRGGQLGIVYNF